MNAVIADTVQQETPLSAEWQRLQQAKKRIDDYLQMGDEQ